MEISFVVLFSWALSEPINTSNAVYEDIIIAGISCNLVVAKYSSRRQNKVKKFVSL